MAEAPLPGSGSVIGPDGRRRCAWAGVEPETGYHDAEWGRPVLDDIGLFERVSLEGFQAGLSWRTILNKRENFRKAFDHFDVEVVSAYTDADVTRLLADAGIIRHRGKIEAVINNAARARELIDTVGSLREHFWSYGPDAEIEPGTMTFSPGSIALSKDLKKRGWRFVGPTTMFALMQAVGVVNDHALDCEFRSSVQAAREAVRTA